MHPIYSLRFIVACLAAAAFITSIAADETNTSPRLADFDQYVATVLKTWNVPGAGIAIVKDGKIVLMKGYGFRDVTNKLPVTPQTVFPIASITKSFTVSTLGTLVGEGKLDWDKPVRDYLPDFRMADDVLGARITTRDMVTHRTGLPRHDGIWYRAGLTREQVYQNLKHLEASKDLRREFQYNNLMYMTAGYLAGKLAGSDWESAVRERIFKPLGMTDSTFEFAEVAGTPRAAKPYRKDDDEVPHEVPAYAADRALGPAGSIASTLEDLTKYLLMFLNDGKAGDKQVVPQAVIGQMTSPQIVLQSPRLDPELGFAHYGLGLIVTSYRGHTFVHHGGNLDGFSLLLSFCPDDRIGSVILLNMEGTPLRNAISREIMDRVLGLSSIDWNKREFDRYMGLEKARKEARAKNYVPRQSNTRFSHALEDYGGDYAHPAYGTVKIERAEKKPSIKVTYHGMKSTAEHWHYDVWRVPHDPLDLLQETQIMFNTDWEGNIASLAIAMEPSVKDIVFIRQPDSQMSQKDFLEPLIGTYEIADFKIKVTLRSDNVLIALLPSQETWELQPLRGRTFSVKDEPSRTLDFKADAEGKITELSLSQAGSSTVAKKR